ncbi:hypothetical protein RB600_003122 [Gaeumannomyces tritici]
MPQHPHIEPVDIVGGAAAVDDAEEEEDDDDDLDDGLVALQRSISNKRREGASAASPIQKVLPFPFAPNVRPLTISDVDSCVALENAAFTNKQHRASREKFEYRLTVCPELCMGVFCTMVPGRQKRFEIETLASAKPVETDRVNGAVSVLLGHIIATMSSSDLIVDRDMEMPSGWRTAGTRSSSVGHQQSGTTVAIHSLAVAPHVQGCGIGQLVMKSYLQQINNSGIATRVALICQENLVNYYKRFGFQHVGPSKCQFGGGGWHDMAFQLAGIAKITPI